MTEERTRLVEVGHRHTNCWGQVAIVAGVDIGQHGVFLSLDFSGSPGHTYLPLELPAGGDFSTGYYNWPCYGTSTLDNGMKVGTVCCRWDDDDGETLPACEALWEKTIEAVEAEGGVMQSRPTDIRLN
ncbi:hypothetical protein LCGC14_1432170 [marine sediment metagenome]|uniref:Uncharacterized protein n=1 Tax=marine sediment metagenome TaxID=412755 RepID=A0A0F9JNN0_9ZZZZ